MDFQINSASDIERLDVSAVPEKLKYVADALPLIKQELNGQTALIGFAGSPWTLANYMLEGGSSKEFTKAKALFYSDPKLFNRFMGKLTDAIVAFLDMQIDAGVDALQIFDSSGGLLAGNIFESASGIWMQRIIAALKGQVPIIVFSRGANGGWDALVRTGAQVLGVDWTVNLREIRELLPDRIGIQGNLDPALLNTTPAIVAAEAAKILSEMRGTTGHIFNLGHGVSPTAKLENIQALVETVRNFK